MGKCAPIGVFAVLIGLIRVDVGEEHDFIGVHTRLGQYVNDTAADLIAAPVIEIHIEL